MLTKKLCLAPYAKDKENMVTADASRTGLGVTLCQKQDSRDIKSLAFGSRYLNDTEKIYSVGEHDYKSFDSISMGRKYIYIRTTKH